MNFEDINYCMRSTTDASGLGLMLPGGYWVQQAYFVEAWTAIWKACPAGQWQGVQTTESLLSDPGWRDRKCGQRLKLGRCVKYFVVHEMLPLREANPGKKGKRKYVEV